MGAGVIRCPNCGQEAMGGYIVCTECGKVFCAYCSQNGKSNYPDGCCPRCGSLRYEYVKDLKDMKDALRRSMN